MSLQALISIRDGLGSSDDYHVSYEADDPKRPEHICHMVAGTCGRDYDGLFKAMLKLDKLVAPISWPSKREYVESCMAYHQHWYIYTQRAGAGRKVTIQGFVYREGQRAPMFLRVIEE